MTIICVRDGIMAVDSFITGGNLRRGTIIKWRAMPHNHGGGFIAGAGNCSSMAVYLDRIADQGLPDDLSGMDDSVSLIWMKADGRMAHVAREGWHEATADYTAEGSGREVAMGAMAMGASAEQAAKIASDLIVDCGGEIHVLRLETIP